MDYWDSSTATPQNAREYATITKNNWAYIVHEILGNPIHGRSLSTWFLRNLVSGLDRDPVDAAADAFLLHKILDARARWMMSAACPMDGINTIPAVARRQ